MTSGALRGALINRIGRVPIVGRVLRWYANRFDEGSIVTIRAGGAAGMRWQRHHRYVNGYWLGNYELRIQAALARLLRPGDVFYDVGGNAGFFTILGAQLVGPMGRVFVFEPLPENIDSVRAQVALNELRQVEVVPLAAGAQDGTADFSFDPLGNSAAHLGAGAGDERTLTVGVTALDTFVREHPAPALVKIDVEGAETEVLYGARELLARGTKLLIELHGQDKAHAVVETLSRASYHFETLDGSSASDPKSLHHVIALPAIS